ncbi:transposase [Brevibacillus sp. FIR094]|uniref:transposase n=1 Tax=Brevibacillus sp. FIR094 TaxID=3134809 RepID=UPI003D19B126
MAKRKRQITGAKNEKYIKEGKKIGKDYFPWLEIQDVPSEGRGTCGKGWTTNRRYEFMSDLERDYFYILDFSDEITDIGNSTSPSTRGNDDDCRGNRRKASLDSKYGR